MPYCVEADNFELMTAGEGALWYRLSVRTS